jgi:hypothetical protein
MEVSYNLRYQKQNFSNKVILDKEGEIVIYTKGFRLKGKGASDKGELINFSEIKEFYYRNERILFITFNKEKYTLSNSGSLFNNLLTDIYKSRNEFLMDALFMKAGKLKGEYEGNFNRVSKFGKDINKGQAKLRLYQRSLIVVPAHQDAFAINFSFVNFHEFDEMEYSLKVVMDDGVSIFFAQLGNDFEFFQEKINQLLGGMYESVVNGVLKTAFMEFHAGTLLKLAFKMKGGKAVNLHDIKEMDEELAVSVENFFYEDENLKEKMDFLRAMVDDYSIYYGVANDDTVEGGAIRWIMFTIPEKNVVAFTVLPRWQDGGAEESEKQKNATYFYRIIMEKGSPADKVEDKVREINHALVNLNFVKDPCFKDKRDLKHSPFQYAIRKLPFLRILRKSYVNCAKELEAKDWQAKVKEILNSTSL